MFNPTAPVNEQLALYSDLFMLIAALVYAAAFILFTIDMATASATIRRLEDELAREGHAEAAVHAPARERELAAGGRGIGRARRFGDSVAEDQAARAQEPDRVPARHAEARRGAQHEWV